MLIYYIFLQKHNRKILMRFDTHQRQRIYLFQMCMRHSLTLMCIETRKNFSVVFL